MDWNNWLLGHEIGIRLGFFFGIFTIVAVWELKAPRRALSVSKGLRWLNNLSIVFLNGLVLRLLFPAAAVGVAAVAGKQGWGLLNIYAAPFPVAVIVAVIGMDLVIYLQHVMVHAVPAL